ncbi:hypothetical protein KAS08_02630 [Candidatus Pacearchaeota archaeon]|nr:hypothetical protein [Candidatus Pacearchaeota archaeon]
MRGRRFFLGLITSILIFSIFGITLTSGTRLPTVGSDADTWGTILNNFLVTEHNSDGSHSNITVDNINLSGNFITKDPYVDVRAFGAKGDGVTDDTIAIQAAIDSLPTAGGTVFFPVGQYRITSNISTSKASVRLLGAGGTSFNEAGGYGSTLIADTANMTLLDFDGNIHLIHQGPIIENINLIDNTGGTATLIKIRLMVRWIIRDVTLRDGLVGLEVDGAGDVVVGGDASWGLVEQVHFANSATGIKTLRGASQTIIGGSFVGCTVGVDIDYYSPNVKIIGTKFDGGTGVWVKGFSNTISDSGFEGCNPAILFDGDSSLAPSPPSGYGNKAIGVDIVGSSGSEIAINITANASETQIIGVRYSNLASDYFIDNSKSTKIYDAQGVVWKSYVSAVPGQAGFILKQLAGGYFLPMFLVNNNFGITLIDDETITGGLWLTADASTRGAVGAGVYGSIAGTFIATGTSAAFTKFFNGIEFYTDTGLTTNTTFTPTKRLTIGTAGGIVLAENTTAITCNAGNAGGIIYSGGKHYGCNETSWNALY